MSLSYYRRDNFFPIISRSREPPWASRQFVTHTWNTHKLSSYKLWHSFHVHSIAAWCRRERNFRLSTSELVWLTWSASLYFSLSKNSSRVVYAKKKDCSKLQNSSMTQSSHASLRPNNLPSRIDREIDFHTLDLIWRKKKLQPNSARCRHFSINSSLIFN